MIRGRVDPTLRAVVEQRRALRYTRAAPHSDRPAHVRAASGLVGVGRGFWVIQDDALYVAEIGDDGAIHDRPLASPDAVRTFDARRGNKSDKPDLEAAFLWPTPAGPAPVLIGSGSAPPRERWWTPGGAVQVAPLYDALRAALAPAPVNVEGAWRAADGALRLLQRGNGRGGRSAVFVVPGSWVDAVLAGDVGPVTLLDRLDLDLGALDGVPLTPTDATPSDGGGWWFTAAAEASPDAIQDGPVAGSVVGWSDDRDVRMGRLVDADGAPLFDKVEGLARDGDRLVVVTDPDDPDRPADRLVVRLDGPW
jgi:hypothetical protein